jgi:hypothetical protein
MAAQQPHVHRSQRRQSSQSWQSSSPWKRESSSPAPDTQEVQDGVLDLVSQSRRGYACRYGGPGGGGGREQEVPHPDGTDAERPRKHRYDSTLDARKELVLLILDNRKISPTQPGRGIRKIVDLYHDLPDLLDKAKKYHTVLNEHNPETIEEMNRVDFIGMSEDDIEEEQKEYAHFT